MLSEVSWFANGDWKIKESSVCFCEGKGMEEIKGVGGEISITSRERDPYQIGGSSNLVLRHELL